MALLVERLEQLYLSLACALFGQLPIMKRNTCILFFTTFTLLAQAQQICSRTSVFFDVDKTKLTVETKQKLDSLITLIGESEFLVELYGHTDSLASSIYNLKLAQSRMDAVKEYITLKSKGKLQFKEKNLGETDKPISDSKEKNLAYNRRVDVFLIPMTNGKLKLDGARGEIVEAPPDYFEPCGVCNSAPVVNAYYNAEEGAKANIVFETTDGEPLITFGTIALNKKPCDQIKMRDDTAMCVFKICRGVNTCPTVWDADTIEGKIYWKRSNSKLELNYETGCFVFRGKCGEGHNLDCIATPDYIEPFKGCCIAQPKVFSYTHAFYIDETKVKRNSDITRDTLLMDCKDSAAHLTGFAKMVERYYYLHTVID